MRLEWCENPLLKLAAGSRILSVDRREAQGGVREGGESLHFLTRVHKVSESASLSVLSRDEGRDRDT